MRVQRWDGDMATKSIGAGWKLTKDGKIVKSPVYHSVSQRIAAKKKPKVKIVGGPR